MRCVSWFRIVLPVVAFACLLVSPARAQGGRAAAAQGEAPDFCMFICVMVTDEDGVVLAAECRYDVVGLPGATRARDCELIPSGCDMVLCDLPSFVRADDGEILAEGAPRCRALDGGTPKRAMG